MAEARSFQARHPRKADVSLTSLLTVTKILAKERTCAKDFCKSKSSVNASFPPPTQNLGFLQLRLLPDEERGQNATLPRRREENRDA